MPFIYNIIIIHIILKREPSKNPCQNFMLAQARFCILFVCRVVYVYVYIYIYVYMFVVAMDALIEARRVLQFTNVLAYYIRSGPLKTLFEYQQQQLTECKP